MASRKRFNARARLSFGVVAWLAVPGALLAGPPIELAPRYQPAPDAEAQSRAAAAFDEGTRAFDDGRFDDAVAAFERAQRLAPHPATAFNLGLALEQAGRDLDAWHRFAQLERDADDPKRREEAAQRRLGIEARISVLRVRAPTRATVCLDGETWAPTAPHVWERPLPPGKHRVSTDAALHELVLVPGETRVLDVAQPSDRAAGGRRRAIVGLSAGAGGMALVSGALATTVAVRSRSASTQADANQGLAWGAASTALVSASLTTAALVLHARRERNRGGKPRPSAMPDAEHPADTSCDATRVEATADETPPP